MTTPLYTLLSDDAAAPPSRLALYDDGEFVTIAQEWMASRSPLAQMTSVHAALDLSETEARWLHEYIGRALQRRAARAATVTT